VYDLRLTVIDGQGVVATSDGLITVDESGRADVLALLPSEISDRVMENNPMLGVAGDRAVHWFEPGELVVTSLGPGDALHVIVTNVAEASQVGTDGSVWLRALNDEPGTLRRLDVAAVEGGQAVDAFDMPAIEIDPAGDVRAARLLSDDGAALTVLSDARTSDHVVRLRAGTDDPASETLAGGLDPVTGSPVTGWPATCPSCRGRPSALMAQAACGSRSTRRPMMASRSSGMSTRTERSEPCRPPRLAMWPR